LTIIKLTKKPTKKSMGRDEQTNKQEAKQTKKPSRFRSNGISVLFSVLVLLLHHHPGVGI
jgi:hypothetical protein